MPRSPTDLEALVRQHAPQIALEITLAASQAHNEPDLVAAVERSLEHFAATVDIELRHERERTLVNGRADAVYNRLVIEYEPPRSLHTTNGARTNQHAIAQVKQYVTEMESRDRTNPERLAGVALDGVYFIFIRYRDDHWRVDDPQLVTPHSTETFLRYLLALAVELALTPEKLQRAFGENSDTSREVVPVLYAALRHTPSQGRDPLSPVAAPVQRDHRLRADQRPA